MEVVQYMPALNEFIENNAKLAFVIGLILFVANYLFAYAMSTLSVFNNLPGLPRLLSWATIEFLIIVVVGAFIMFLGYILLGAESMQIAPSPDSSPLLQNQFALFLIFVPYIAMIFLRKFIVTQMLDDPITWLQGFAALVMHMTFFYLLPTFIVLTAILLNPPVPMAP